MVLAMQGKVVRNYSLILLLTLKASSVFGVEFDFHNHGQSDDSYKQWSDTQKGITLKVSGSEDIYQTSNGFGIDEGELDAKNGHEDSMTFTFVDEKTQKPLNVIINNLRVKMFEPKVAKDSATLSQLDGKHLTTLDASLDFKGTAGFEKDRHISNSWSLKALNVFSGFTIQADHNAGFYVYGMDVELMDMPARFVSQPLTHIAEGQAYSYQVEVTDENVSAVKLSLTQAPEGMTFDPISSRIHWLSGFEAEGSYPISISANDSEGQISEQKFTLNVANSNQIPSITSIPLTQGKENFPYTYVLKTLDKDQDSVFLKLVSAPNGMRLDEETQTLHWTPDFNDAGVHKIHLSVSDVYDESGQEFDVVIADNNRLPVISSDAPDDGREGQMYTYVIHAEDPDKDPLTFQLLHAPDGMSVHEETGEISWQPNYLQAGQHHVELQTHDGKQGVDVQRFDIDIKNTNRAPVIVSDPVISAKENTPYRYRIAVEDADFDGVVVSLDDGPSGMKLDPVSNSLFWLPDFDDQGDYAVTLIASDGKNKVKQHFDLNVQNVNRQPELQVPETQQLSEGDELKLTLKANDLDDDELTFVLTQAPESMRISDAHIHWPVGYDQAGLHQVRVKVVDSDKGEHEVQFSLEVNNVNRLPLITSEPVLSGRENQHYFYHLLAHDTDDDRLTYRLLSAPEGMSLDADNGYLSWNPGYDHAGKHTVLLQVSDGIDTVNQPFDLAITDNNREPEIVSVPVVMAIEDNGYQYQLEGRDADADKLAFTLLAGPEGMVLNNETGQLTWTPGWLQAGYHQVIIELEDGKGGRDVQSYNLQVENQNRPPLFIGEALTSTFEQQPYRHQLLAQDADDDRLQYQLISGPVGMTFDAYTHTLSWLPDYNSAGEYTVNVSVSDGQEQVDKSFTVWVQDTNRKPTINSVAPLTLNEGGSYEYQLLASDSDNDALIYTLQLSPEGMVINEKTGLITWQSGYDDAGQQGIEVMVDDGKGGIAVQTYSLIVKHVNRKPVFISEPVLHAEGTYPYRYQLLAKDADWDSLTYNIVQAPKGMALDKKTHTLYWNIDKIKAAKLIAAKHNVIISVSDGSARVNQAFDITVQSDDDTASEALSQ